MAVLKCKMCAGNLKIVDEASTAECEYCGSIQTIPKMDDEKKMTLFARANRLRMSCEFDKAAGIYEAIVADFPEEAEAYWGSVLCRYGIEYVDDPGTGRKVPTCHRSSFASVMDDPDFEQALENADLQANRVYRKEAKQIEEIRKGIIAVSANEEPYDIFICYKETAENGDRTLDSVLAQEVYDALTGKGYRVFFSRITLEDHLGVEYEPYIFAALNTAKIMLAFGTDYEYFNAVWVKNEWSRYLKLMAKDKSKHLIPCYKDIDVYHDMPKEFAKLQAQDLGKVGAMQDLLRGIEKILPRNGQPQIAPKETVVVQQTGGTNANALVKRGYMALEDKQYDKADGFFEEALNHDAECGEAYIGKFLAKNKHTSLEEWAEVFNTSLLFTGSRVESVSRNTQKEKELVEIYSLPGFEYAEKTQMQRFLDEFKFTYDSRVEGLSSKRRELEEKLKKDPNLSRGFRFAKGDFLDTLNKTRDKLLAHTDSLLTKEKTKVQTTRAKLEAEYSEHLSSTELVFRGMREKAEMTREDRYIDLCRKQADTSNNADDFERLAAQFRKLSGYSDSDERVHQCNKRCNELRTKAQQEAAARWAEKKRIEEAQREAERRAAEARQEEQRRALAEYERQQAKIKTRNRAIVLVTFTLVVAIIAFAVISGIKAAENQRIMDYDAAESMYLAGDLDGALAAFGELGIYRDAEDRCMQIKYELAQNLLDSGSYQEAISAFQELGDYQDSKMHLLTAWDGVVQRKTIAFGDQYIVAVKTDGTVITTVSEDWGDYRDKGQLDTSGWTDIVAVACGNDYTVGLRSDGTVVATGQNYYGQCDVSEWTDIVAIEAGANRTVGLRSDGTVLVASDTYWEGNHSKWTDIVSIHQFSDYTCGIRADGTLEVAARLNPNSSFGETLEDLKSVVMGGGIFLGLKQDGTVYIEEDMISDIDLEPVESWRDIIDVCTIGTLSAAVRSDGTVVYAKHLSLGNPPDFSGWTDVVDITMFRDVVYGDRIIGLRSDGTLLTMYFDEEKATELSQWTDIKIPNR